MSNTITTIEVKNVENINNAQVIEALTNMGLNGMTISVSGNIFSVKVPFSKVLTEEQVTKLEDKYEIALREYFTEQPTMLVRMKTLRRSMDKKVTNDVDF